MPSYNVKCTNEECENSQTVYEVRKKMIEDYPPCDKCGSPIQSVFQPVGFVLKGRGWCGASKKR